MKAFEARTLILLVLFSHKGTMPQSQANDNIRTYDSKRDANVTLGAKGEKQLRRSSKTQPRTYILRTKRSPLISLLFSVISHSVFRHEKASTKTLYSLL